MALDVGVPEGSSLGEGQFRTLAILDFPLRGTQKTVDSKRQQMVGEVWYMAGTLKQRPLRGKHGGCGDTVGWGTKFWHALRLSGHNEDTHC